MGGPPDTGNTSSKGIKRSWSLFLYSESHAWEMGSKHALCNTKPEWQPYGNTEAPGAVDGVQPTVIRVLEEHKHQVVGPCSVEHFCGSKASSEAY